MIRKNSLQICENFYGVLRVAPLVRASGFTNDSNGLYPGFNGYGRAAVVKSQESKKAGMIQKYPLRFNLTEFFSGWVEFGQEIIDPKSEFISRTSLHTKTCGPLGSSLTVFGAKPLFSMKHDLKIKMVG